MDTVNKILGTCKEYALKFVSLLKTAPDHTAEFDQKDIESNTLMAVLCYLSWLVLIPYFLCKNSRYVRFHINQGVVLALVHTVLAIALNILGKIPLLGIIFSLIAWLVGVLFFCLSIWGLVNALRGIAKELPFVANVRIVK